jgi:Domain of unknown function (DUF4436)
METAEVRRALIAVVAVLVIAAGSAVSVFAFVTDRAGLETAHTISATAADRVEIHTEVQKVDPTGRELTLRVLVTAEGRFAEDGNVLVPRVDLLVESTSLGQGTLRFTAGQRISSTDIPVSLNTGTVADYPRDGYRATVGFTVESAGTAVPANVSIADNDPFFRTQVKRDALGMTGFDLRLSRSRGTLILAWFMMLLMWLLALGVLSAAWVIIVDRRGLVWPALGWMAASLFALVSFRNAAPGSPPIGCLMDYGAFIWAEAIIATCLAAVTFTGFLLERPTRRQASVVMDGESR